MSPAEDVPRTFAIDDPLPRGVTVLDASAGTGKTFAIAALVTRYVAEMGVGLDELLVVTFTRAATTELRDRIQRRLIEARDHLEQVLADAAVTTTDPVLAAVADADPEERQRRAARLEEALASIDRAQIATIHGWCQQALGGLGLAADLPGDLDLLEDESELIEQVTRDLLVEHFTPRPGAPKLDAVRAAVIEAVRHPHARILPEGSPDLTDESEPPGRSDQPDDGEPTDNGDQPDDPHATGRLVAWLAREARVRLRRRKRALGVIGHQDLLGALRDTLHDEVRGPGAVAGLRARTRIALIDEFQDTDPVQWDILSTLFAAPGSAEEPRALVLIGDPKQAIYRFRGADVRAYLAATRAATDRRTLTTNWRSDGALLTVLDNWLSGTVYGEAGIEHTRVEAAPGHAGSRVTGEAWACAPLTIRAIVRDPVTGKGAPSRVRDGLLVDDVVAHLGRLLAPGTLRLPAGDGHRDLRPGDVAILVRANNDALTLQRALRDRGITAVLNSVGSVLETEAASAWRDLLDALERTGDDLAVRRVAAGPFLDVDAGALLDADDVLLDRLHTTVQDWAGVLHQGGMGVLARVVADRSALAARLLRERGGERRRTDLLHVADLLHTAERAGHRGPAGLRAWLVARMEDAAARAVPSEEQARRLESDAEAVQLLTVHRSKGLEFPVVLNPYLWVAVPNASAPYTAGDPDGGWTIDVGPKDRPGAGLVKARMEAELLGEQLRLAYVALTRARHLTVAWWVAPGRARTSAVDRLLFSRDEAGRVDTSAPPVMPPGKDPDAVMAALEQVAAQIGCALVEVGAPPAPGDATTTPASGPELTRARRRGRVDRTWRRTSYSGLVDDHGHGRAGGEAPAAGMRAEVPEDTGITVDEPDPPSGEPDPPSGESDPPSGEPDPPADPVSRADDGRALDTIALPMAAVPGSAAFGTMIHEVLELVAFDPVDLEAALATQLDRAQRRHRLPGDREAILRGLVAAVRTPLGPLADDRPLAGTSARDRLDEPRFELAIAGGDRPRAAAALGRIADLLDIHLTSDDPLAGYADDLRATGPRGLVRGYLTGAIDLVLRVGDGSDARYLVVDHKTNRLGGQTPTAADYTPAALARAMRRSHYPLQALLYQVAVHRMLRGRLPGYEPARHLGGVAYLFLRGMTGPTAPRVDGQPCGVFAWRPPDALVVALDQLLAGHTAEADGAAEADEVTEVAT